MGSRLEQPSVSMKEVPPVKVEATVESLRSWMEGTWKSGDSMCRTTVVDEWSKMTKMSVWKQEEVEELLKLVSLAMEEPEE